MLDNFRAINLVWDKATRRIDTTIRAASSDERGRKLVVQVLNNSEVEDLTGANLHLYWETKDREHHGLDLFEPVDITKGIFEIYFTTGMLSNVGNLKTNLHLYDGEGVITSEDNIITVFRGIDSEAIESSDSFTSLTEALLQVDGIYEEFQENESERQETFDNNESNRQSEFDTNENERRSTFTSNETQRQSDFETSENQRDTTFQGNEDERKTTFESNEEDRQETFDANEALRESSEAGRVSAEQNRVIAENERNDLYDLVQQKLADGEFIGEKGDTGDGLEYVWDGTKLGVRKEGETEYIYVDLKGDKGETGEIENLDSTHIVDALGYVPISVDDVPDSNWENLQNKPTEFNPTSHAHSIDDITGLRDELDSVPELTKETVETALGFSPLPPEGGNIKTYVKTTSRPTVSETTVLDLSLSNFFEVSLSKPTTLSITNPDTRANIRQSFDLIIYVEYTPQEIVFPENVIWQGGEIPDLTGPNKTYTLTLMTVDNGISWYGMLDGEFPGKYVLAKDSDFSGTDDGNFKYIGTDEYVEIPHVIKGVSVTSYMDMFNGTSAKGVASNNKNITNMRNMFKDSQATTLDLSSLDTSSVEHMGSMFNGSQATTLDLSSFDTSSVTNMGNMFKDSQATTLDLSSFDTSNVTTISSMFSGSKATTLDLSSFDTSNVKSASSVFKDSQATTLDLSSFDTSNVRTMSNMFEGSKATTLDLSSFDTSNVTYMSSMFKDSKATIGYARTQEDADKFNSSSNKPAGLIFVVK